MNILITGGSGFIGSNCAEFFSRKKTNRIVVLDNFSRSKLFKSDFKTVEHNWQHLKNLDNVSLVQGDIRKSSDIKKAINKGVDVVIHCAAQPGVGFSLSEPLKDFQLNAFGTINLLENIRRVAKKCTFIYCSSNKVYGENVNKIPIIKKKKRYNYKGKIKGIDENMSLDLTPHSPYGVSKLVGDLYAQEYALTYGFKTAVFRMSCIYGRGQFPFEDHGWIGWFILSVLKNNKINIYGDGKQVRDILYVSDLVRLFDLFVKSKIEYGIFNIGGGIENSVSLLELLDYIKVLTNKEINIDFKEWRTSDQRIFIANTAKANKLLGWKPCIDVRKGLEKMITWIKETIY